MTRRFLLLLLSAVFALPASGQETLTVDKIMQDPEAWIGGWPSLPSWHESGDTLYFEWNPRGRYPSDSLFRVTQYDLEPVKVSAEERRAMGPMFDGWHHGEHVYDPGFERKAYERNGEIWMYDRGSERTTRLTRTPERERNPRFARGGSGLIYRRGDNLFYQGANGNLEQLTDIRAGTSSGTPEADAQDSLLERRQLELFEFLRRRKAEREAEDRQREQRQAAAEHPPTFYAAAKNVDQLQIDPTERFVTFFLVEQQSRDKRTRVSDYVTESGYVESLEARPKVGYPPESQEFYVQDLARDTTIRVDLHTVAGGIDSTRVLHAYGPYWSVTGRYAAMDVRTWDNKDRWIVQLNPAAGTFSVLDHQHDEAWLQAPGISSQGGPSPVGWLTDGKTFFFRSESSGRSHIYTADMESGEVRQVTHGDFDVYDPLLSRDGSRWFFASNENSPFERHYYTMPVSGGERIRLTDMSGKNEVALHPEEDVLGIRHSYTSRPPEIYLQDLADGGVERITTSVTDEWLGHEWRDPEITTFRASDDADVPAQIFMPENPNGAAVLFVHGAGYLQNVHRWWSDYFREYMFHNLLADEGYVVMNVDYRGSSGYGRDWRTSVYRHMGGRDLQDFVDASQYLGREHGIEPERVFIYGGSYGGFITLMALFTEPEHFGGGAALRSVTDWAHYHYGYTANILNTPMEDSVAFTRSSPIYFAEGLEDPLLIAHGMIDRNVHFQDVVRLAQRLIELGKEDWEMAVYPLEGHGFEEPESWADEYRRILKYIHLSVGPPDAARKEVPYLRDERNRE